MQGSGSDWQKHSIQGNGCDVKAIQISSKTLLSTRRILHYRMVANFQKNQHLIENLQRQFIKTSPEFKGVQIGRTHWKKEETVLSADLVFLYKMYKGRTQPPYESMFQFKGYG